ncbi:uncharacterized protein LOC129586031 [Paramacrobiotus metropolitanus]|uniref:uncharacterized protein LOC129586031 n=1 Tax=Paramacrobiotus metropolitanus TaxID=2943436 RepID=UPI002445BE24|nr:uncharacterized protein LOC129586031 [Paramacrobiotus metropolitanus]
MDDPWVVTYRHLMLKSVRSYSGLHPVMIGAIMIHTGKSQEAYSYLPFFLKKHRPELRDLRAFGSDEDQAIGNAFKVAFPKAAHFLCDLHLKDTVKRKMSELGLEHYTAAVIMEDVFGALRENTVCGGLVNCTGAEYDNELEKALEKWSFTEAGERFAIYFRKHKAQQVKESALLEHRIAAGMGLNVYTQNANECSNNVLKQTANHEKATINDFVDLWREVSIKQSTDIEQAGMGRSERLFLLDDYKHLHVKDRDFYNSAKNPSAPHRARTMKSIHSAKLLPKALNFSSDFATIGTRKRSENGIDRIVVPKQLQEKLVKMKKLKFLLLSRREKARALRSLFAELKNPVIEVDSVVEMVCEDKSSDVDKL